MIFVFNPELLKLFFQIHLVYLEAENRWAAAFKNNDIAWNVVSTKSVFSFGNKEQPTRRQK